MIAHRRIVRSFALFCVVAACTVESTLAGFAQSTASDSDWLRDVLAFRCEDIAPSIEAKAKSDDPASLAKLAIMYDRGCGVVQDMRKAERLFETALAKGSKDPLAIGYVALYGSDSDDAKGIAVLTKAASSGNTLAGTLLGGFYFWRSDAQTDQDLSDEWYAKAITGGDLWATAVAGAIETRIPDKHAAGKAMLDRAVSANVPIALASQGLCYLDGVDGYGSNPSLAKSFIDRAIATGSASARFKIAFHSLETRYLPGDTHTVVPTDVVHALEASVPRLLPKAQMDAYLGEAELFSSDPSDHANGFEHLLEGENSTKGEFDLSLAFAYQNGRGVVADRRKWVTLMRLAAKKGDPNAMAFFNGGNSSSSSRNNFAQSNEDYLRIRQFEREHPMNPTQPQ